jgi:hydroxymethylpyrimidine pyrophosphatase-like HAD family hydrolase
VLHKSKRRLLLGIDFDHTIVNGDQVLPGAKEAIQLLKDKGCAILIHSCNNKDWITKVLRANDIPFDYIWDSANDVGKPVCDWYIDDRAIGFRGDWNAVVREVYGNDASAEAGKE